MIPIQRTLLNFMYSTTALRFAATMPLKMLPRFPYNYYFQISHQRHLENLANIIMWPIGSCDIFDGKSGLDGNIYYKWIGEG